MLSGEPCTPALLARVARRAPGAPCVNQYGPTEATVTTHRGRPRPGPAVRVDRSAAMPGTTVHVLDAALRPVPPGVFGEVHIGGTGVSRGYRDRPGATAAGYLPDPVRAARRADVPHRRRGSPARRRDAGVRGRLDRQVKVRGVRVEPAEVEAILTQHEAITAAAVTGQPGPDGQTRLVAYIVPRDGSPDEPDESDTDTHRTAVHLDRWRRVWETAVNTAASDPAFDIAGWVASDTGDPIPVEHMREWVDTTATRLRRLRPRHILDIGCGTGLLLWRLAPHCEQYTATDFAAAPLDALARRLPDDVARRVRLFAGRRATSMGLWRAATTSSCSTPWSSTSPTSPICDARCVARSR